LKQLGGTLSGRELQMLAIGRGLTGSARSMLLDENFNALVAAIQEFGAYPISV
jgi:ABC-type branched-subunit amino acid transport system ATPase component